MNNLNTYHVQELPSRELVSIDGGSYKDWFDAGIAAGKALAKAIKKWWND